MAAVVLQKFQKSSLLRAITLLTKTRKRHGLSGARKEAVTHTSTTTAPELGRSPTPASLHARLQIGGLTSTTEKTG